jgi:hypothetical protein
MRLSTGVFFGFILSTCVTAGVTTSCTSSAPLATASGTGSFASFAALSVMAQSYPDGLGIVLTISNQAFVTCGALQSLPAKGVARERPIL